MNIDIIALAKEANGHIAESLFEKDDINIHFYKAGLEKFAAILEAEIRKEINKEINIAAIVSEDTDILMQEITTLTEQNAKLIEALKQAEREQREAVREAAAEAARQERFPDEPYGTY